MQDLDVLKAQVKKLNQRATALKLELHDLSEELPSGWEKIPEIAARTHGAYAALFEARQNLAAAGG